MLSFLCICADEYYQLPSETRSCGGRHLCCEPCEIGNRLRIVLLNMPIILDLLGATTLFYHKRPLRQHGAR